MAVTVSRPVTQTAPGLGGLASLLGVYVGYQNMRTRRADEIGKVSGYASEREYLGQENPYQNDKQNEGESQSISAPKLPGLSNILSPVGTKGITPAGVPQARQPVRDSSGDKVLPTAPGQPPELETTDTLIPTKTNPIINAVTSPKVEAEREKFRRWAGTSSAKLKRDDWGDIQAKREISRLPAADRAFGRRVINATKSSVSDEVAHTVIKKNMTAMPAGSREEVRKRSGFTGVYGSTGEIERDVGKRRGQRGYFKAATDALSDNVKRGMIWAAGDERKELRIYEEAMIRKESINEDSNSNRNPYRDILNKRYGILGRKVGRSRGAGRAPKQYQWIDENGRSKYVTAHSPEQGARKLSKKLKKKVPWENVVESLDRGADVAVRGNIAERRALESDFRSSVRKNKDAYPSEGDRIHTLSAGKQVPYYNGTSWQMVEKNEYRKKMANQYETKGVFRLFNENEEKFQELYGFNFEDYMENRTKGESLDAYMLREKIPSSQLRGANAEYNAPPSGVRKYTEGNN